MNKLTDFMPSMSGTTATLGVIGGAIAAAFGGWDGGMITLLIFMGVDYVSGLIVAGVFNKSGNSENGALESRAGWKGLCRKGMTLFMVLIAAQLDKVIGFDMIRDAVVIAYIANETISIIENAGLMGVPIPKIMQKAIDVLSKKAQVDDE